MKSLIKKYRFLGKPLFLILSFSFFYSSFQKNILEFASPRMVEVFAMGTESFIINRIAITEREGKKAYAGFLGRIPEMDNTPQARIKVPRGRSNLDAYYNYFNTYVGEYPFKPYMSNLGLQARILAWLKNSNLLDSGENFSNYRAIFSFISALIFAMFCFYFLKEFGSFVAIFLVLYIAQLDWIVSSAAHMFWFSGLMFVPFISNFFLLKRIKESNSTIKFLFTAIILTYSFSFLKCLSSGYEVISSFLVMNTIPVFYYWIKDRWKILRFLVVFISISFVSLAGVFSSMVIQAHQIDVLKSEAGAGKNHLLSSYFRRSSGKGIRPNMPDRVKESYRVSSFDVIKKYWNSSLVTLNDNYHNPKGILKANALVLTLVIITLIYLMVLYLGFVDKILEGLLICTWVSLISPLSMFVLFKSLSWLHPHLVPITWNMPFSILMAVIVLYVLKKLIVRFKYVLIRA